METIITPIIFYLVVLFCLIRSIKSIGLKQLFSAIYIDKFKYHLGIAAFFFLNINVLFFCACCGHCHDICISFSLSSVLIGTVVYLSHLLKQTRGGDFMSPFFSIPYFYLLYEIYNVLLNGGFPSLHALEPKMTIALLYPFFSTLSTINKI